MPVLFCFFPSFHQILLTPSPLLPLVITAFLFHFLKSTLSRLIPTPRFPKCSSDTDALHQSPTQTVWSYGPNSFCCIFYRGSINHFFKWWNTRDSSNNLCRAPLSPDPHKGDSCAKQMGVNQDGRKAVAEDCRSGKVD